MRTARKYYAHALDLKPHGNLRAVYGLLLASAALGATASSKGKGSKTDNAEVFSFARSQLLQIYATEATPMGIAVRGMLATLVE